MPKFNWDVQPPADSTFIGLTVTASTRSGAIAVGEAAFMRQKAENVANLSDPAEDATEDDLADLAKALAYWRELPCPTFTATKIGRA